LFVKGFFEDFQKIFSISFKAFRFRIYDVVVSAFRALGASPLDKYNISYLIENCNM